MLKQIIIPVAAFAITVTSASAFSGEMLDRIDVDLSDTQVAALEEVHELRLAGEADREEVKEIFEDAGIDKDLVREIHEAAKKVRTEIREAVREAVDNNDYEAFMDAIEGTPLEDAIDSEDDFDLFVDAHDLRESGDYEGAREIMNELGIKRPGGHGHGFGGHGHRGGQSSEG